MRLQWWFGPTAALGMAACGSPSAPDASWVQVAEHTACEAMNPQYCTGAFGFTVASDGRYTVGPADGGAAVSGSITSAERAQLSSDAALVSASLTSNPTCDPGPRIPGVGDRVDFVDSRGGTVPVYELGLGGVCYRASRDAAARLHADLAALMAKYYPRPFPPL
ncbi:MAG: hypothetical protein ACHQNV_08445 [Vicinamibacteria bacterium]